MNTKIKLWIAVGIVFAFSIMVVEFFWLSDRNKVSINTPSTSNTQELIAQKKSIQKNKTSTDLMKEVIIKDNPEISNGAYFGVESYKIFEEIKSPYSEKTAVIFGLDPEKTQGCCSEPIGIFINNQGVLNNQYYILKGALEHMYLDNVKWQDAKTVFYDVVISDEGGKQITQETINITTESENKVIKECDQDKKICPDGILVSRILENACNFPTCARGKYDMSDSTYKIYTNEQYGIRFKYPEVLAISNFVEHENEYDGDLIVKMDYISSEKDRMNIKLYFSKNLSKYPDLSKTVAKIRKSTGASVNELHSFGFTGFEGYEILWWKTGGKNIKEENYQFLKLENGFYYFKTDSIQPLKDSDKYIYNIISTFESIKN